MPSLLQLGLQYLRFGTVGLAATTTHVLLFTALIEFGGLAPLVANLAAFGVAVLVSFVGHFHWTFRGQTTHHEEQPGKALARFVVVALTGLALNSMAVYLITNVMALPYPYAIVLMIVVVPLIIFALSKFWAFA